MTISAEVKAAAIQKNRRHETDSGSPEVQVAILTERVADLTNHLKGHPGDQHNRRGLLAMVSRRNRLLGYLAGEDREKYLGLIDRLGLRK